MVSFVISKFKTFIFEDYDSSILSLFLAMAFEWIQYLYDIIIILLILYVYNHWIVYASCFFCKWNESYNQSDFINCKYARTDYIVDLK